MQAAKISAFRPPPDRLISMSTRERLQQRHERTTATRSSLASSFNEVDADGDEAITYAEWRSMSSNAGRDEESLQAAFRALDHDGNGTVDRAEFLRVTMLDALSKNYTRANDLIKAMDRDGNRKVDKPEFRSFIKRLGFEAAPATADGIFDAIDEDGSGERIPQMPPPIYTRARGPALTPTHPAHTVSFKEVEDALKPAAAVALKPKLASKARRKKKKKSTTGHAGSEQGQDQGARQRHHAIDVGGPDPEPGPTESEPLLGEGDAAPKRPPPPSSFVCAKLGLPQPPHPYGRLVDLVAALLAARAALGLFRTLTA